MEMALSSNANPLLPILSRTSIPSNYANRTLKSFPDFHNPNLIPKFSAKKPLFICNSRQPFSRRIRAQTSSDSNVNVNEDQISDFIIEDVPHLTNFLPDLPSYPNPLKKSQAYAIVKKTFVSAEDMVAQKIVVQKESPRGVHFRRAGPREKVYFTSEEVRACIVTCGGLCPGINTVLREIVCGLNYMYGVDDVLGIQGGYRGFYSKNTIKLTPKVVNDIHKRGGTFLQTSRGGHDTSKIVDNIQDRGINQVYVIGGDGTQKGAAAIYREVEKRGLRVAVAGIPKTIDNDIAEWGLDKVFTIIVDNARANETAISYFRRKMIGWGNDKCVLDDKYLHMRCFAHIVNLIVCEGLKEAHDSIVSIRNAIKYVKSLPARYEKLKECATKEKIESKSLVFLDMPTRWNSTYLMLQAALKYQKAFERLEEEDGHYLSYFREDDGGRKRGGPPFVTDWENASIFVKFLKGFYDITLKFSTSINVSSTIYLHEVCSLVADLADLSSSENYLLGEMTTKMKRKFDKYGGNMDNVNQMLLIATVLDSRYKLDYVQYCFCDIYNDKQLASRMTETLKENLFSIYDWYVMYEGSPNSQVSMDISASGLSFASQVNSASSASSARISKFKEQQAAKDSIEIKNDVERYLLDACEDIENKKFDVLDWWKVHGCKYRTLSKLAKNVLAVQVSTWLQKVLLVREGEF